MTMSKTANKFYGISNIKDQLGEKMHTYKQTPNKVLEKEKKKKKKKRKAKTNSCRMTSSLIRRHCPSPQYKQKNYADKIIEYSLKKSRR